jgi:DUF1016 N-terminal domain
MGRVSHISSTFPDERIVSTLCRQLSWSHLRLLMYLDDPIKREFYIEMAQLERWSVRQLQERINSMLYERTALSRQPEETIRHDLEQLRQTQQVSPDLLLKDPYFNFRYLVLMPRSVAEPTDSRAWAMPRLLTVYSIISTRSFSASAVSS